jgi:hypothetical protein
MGRRKLIKRVGLCCCLAAVVAWFISHWFEFGVEYGGNSIACWFGHVVLLNTRGSGILNPGRSRCGFFARCLWPTEEPVSASPPSGTTLNLRIVQPDEPIDVVTYVPGRSGTYRRLPPGEAPPASLLPSPRHWPFCEPSRYRGFPGRGRQDITCICLPSLDTACS